MLNPYRSRRTVQEKAKAQTFQICNYDHRIIDNFTEKKNVIGGMAFCTQQCFTKYGQLQSYLKGGEACV